MRSISYISLLVLLAITGCVDPIDVGPVISGSANTSGILVIEASLTDEVGAQQIFISRSRSIQSDSTVNVGEEVIFTPNTPFISPKGLDVDPETNALVVVTGSNGNSASFNETEPGIYAAPENFQVAPNIDYQLTVTTDDGVQYASTEMSMVGSSNIDALYAERITSDSGLDGMGIFVDTSDPNNESTLYRYTFEETYKIIAPNWRPFEFEIIEEGGEFILDEETGDVLGITVPAVGLIEKKREEQVCFKTDPSQDILLLDASGLQGAVAKRKQLRFINSNNPILSHRYSILVRQMAVSFEAFQFYENLRNFTQSELVFSQVQPGPLEGNITSDTEGSPVIGFFDISSVSSQRMYFNYEDFYPDEPLPPYFGTVTCDRFLAPILGDPERDGPPPPPLTPCPQPLIPRIKLGLVEWLASNDPGICEGPYQVTPTICGDCNIVGSNIVPEFWTEE